MNAASSPVCLDFLKQWFHFLMALQKVWSSMGEFFCQGARMRNKLMHSSQEQFAQFDETMIDLPVADHPTDYRLQ